MNGAQHIELVPLQMSSKPPTTAHILAPYYHCSEIDLKAWSLDAPYLVLTETKREEKGLDLVDHIDGLYRVIDLISEQGSGGLVDKMVISPHICGLVESLSPGAFHGLTKVDLEALDNIIMKPMGIYGSKQQIVRYLKEQGAVTDEVEALLLGSQALLGDASKPVLRAGVYAFLQPKDMSAEEPNVVERADSKITPMNGLDGNFAVETTENPSIQNARRVSLIFWPEDTTWDDNAKAPVRRNRTTFMRYLTKATEQVVLMVSDEHLDKFVWNKSRAELADDLEKAAAEGEDENEESDDEGDATRIFSFEVSQSEEVDKKITVRDGFSIKHPQLKNNPQRHATIATKPGQLDTRLVTGEAAQAVMTVQPRPRNVETRKLDKECTDRELNEILSAPSTSLRLSPNIPQSSAMQLITQGALGAQYPGVVAAWGSRQSTIDMGMDKDKHEARKMIEQGINAQKDLMNKAVENVVVAEIVRVYPTLDAAKLRILPNIYARNLSDVTPEEFLKKLFQRHRDMTVVVRKMFERENLADIQDAAFLQLKTTVLASKLLFSQLDIDDHDQQLRLASYLKEGEYEDAILLIDTYEPVKSTCDPIAKAFPRVWSSCTGQPIVRGSLKHAIADAQNVANDRFIGQLDLISNEYPVLAKFAVEARSALYTPLKQKVPGLVDALVAKLEQAQALDISNDLIRLLYVKRDEAQERSFRLLMEELEEEYNDEANERTVIIDKLDRLSVHKPPDDEYDHASEWRLRKNQYRTKGKIISRGDYCLHHELLPLKLSEIDQHEMRINPAHIPRPILKDEAKIEFAFPLGNQIILIQLLDRNRCLLVLETDSDDIVIYVEELPMLSHALQEGKHKKHFPKANIATEVICAYNESCRRLVFSNRTFPKNDFFLHSFIIDEEFATLTTQAVIKKRLGDEADSTAAEIHSLACIPGQDIIAPVGPSGVLQFFAFNDDQPECVSNQVVDAKLIAAFGSPDGKMLVAIKQQDNDCIVESFTWDADQGIDDPVEITTLPLPSSDLEIRLSSINGKENVYLLIADLSEGVLRSFALGHADLSSNFYFKEMQEKQKMLLRAQSSHHNSLLDCHYDVWTRFPVSPPIHRQSLVLSRELPKLLGFVSSSSGSNLEAYFNNLLEQFRFNTTKSSVQDVGSFQHFACTFDAFIKEIHSWGFWKRIASYKTGQWLSNIFCLVPIHIAIAHNNQFIPIKDGVWNAHASARATGRKLEQVVDTLSFGWYESLFQSYMSQMSVKVVSSMGEQSVGKSFALNHFVDSTFAGSAMRTTEGVWMSVTPTPRCLVVALDFEGVHSLERTPTEDTLLVLFNAAISNLILFRNNYALSRDITGLLQSFQSSSTVLKPEDNPTLFNSKLMFIIKDVVDYDRVEIAQEFQLKLQAIVQKEQASNFITNLHRGHVDIITWPVIESPDFYTMFKNLSIHLSNMQGHDTARNFLRMMKMLMAKLKLHDWGSLSSNMTMYKVKYILSTLPSALAYGAAEAAPQLEPLKNIDTNTAIKYDDSHSIFWVKSLGERGNKLTQSDTLLALCKSWSKYSERTTMRKDENDWLNSLTEYLAGLVDLRKQHIETWVQENIQNCPQHAEEIHMLKAMLDTEYQQLKLATRLCRFECKDCRLGCINALYHDGAHSCGTNHKCALPCEFTNVHPGETRQCNLQAGHSEKHVCNPKIHVCGETCSLKKMYGCKKICEKEIGHTDKEHTCAAPQHMCGERCNLQSAKTHLGSNYNCSRLCIRPWDEEHSVHICEHRQICPIQCKLCQNTCSTPDHLHGLSEHAYHLCGQEHECEEKCESEGACRIDKTTSSNSSKRQLRCAIPIPAGRFTHESKHVHGLEEDLFHFCANRCYCLEYCTLPYGHSQSGHEVEHARYCVKNWARRGKSS